MGADDLRELADEARGAEWPRDFHVTIAMSLPNDSHQPFSGISAFVVEVALAYGWILSHFYQYF